MSSMTCRNCLSGCINSQLGRSLADSHTWQTGTPTKRQVSKRQVSKHPVSKRLKRQIYKTSGLQNVRFTKRQVSKRLVSKRPVFKFDILIIKPYGNLTTCSMPLLYTQVQN